MHGSPNQKIVRIEQPKKPDNFYMKFKLTKKTGLSIE